MPGASRSIVIDAPIEKVFQVITDYEKSGEYLTEVRSARVENRRGNECDVHYEVDVIKRIKYAVHMKEEPPKRLSWTVLQGEFMRDNKGLWELEPDGPTRTKCTYTIEMELGPLVPKTIVKALVETSLPKMLEATKKRAESLK